MMRCDICGRFASRTYWYVMSQWAGMQGDYHEAHESCLPPGAYNDELRYELESKIYGERR